MNTVTAALAVLESQSNDSFKVVRENYRKLIKRYHPDANLGESIDEAIEKTKELNWAYEIICGLNLSPDDTFENIETAGDYDSAFSSMFEEFIKNMNLHERFEDYDDIEKIVEELCKEFFDRFSFGFKRKILYCEGAPENREAYIWRGKNGEDKSCFLWDPQVESWENFGWSLDIAINESYETMVHEITGIDSSYYSWEYYTLLRKSYRNASFCLLQEEYVRPFYCMSKIVESVGQVIRIEAEVNK